MGQAPAAVDRTHVGTSASTSRELVALHHDQLAATWAEIGPRGQNSSAVSRHSGSVSLNVNVLADAVAVAWRDAY